MDVSDTELLLADMCAVFPTQHQLLSVPPDASSGAWEAVASTVSPSVHTEARVPLLAGIPTAKFGSADGTPVVARGLVCPCLCLGCGQLLGAAEVREHRTALNSLCERSALPEYIGCSTRQSVMRLYSEGTAVDVTEGMVDWASRVVTGMSPRQQADAMRQLEELGASLCNPRADLAGWRYAETRGETGMPRLVCSDAAGRVEEGDVVCHGCYRVMPATAFRAHVTLMSYFIHRHRITSRCNAGVSCTVLTAGLLQWAGYGDGAGEGVQASVQRYISVVAPPVGPVRPATWFTEQLEAAGQRHMAVVVALHGMFPLDGPMSMRRATRELMEAIAVRDRVRPDLLVGTYGPPASPVSDVYSAGSGNSSTDGEGSPSVGITPSPVLGREDSADVSLSPASEGEDGGGSVPAGGVGAAPLAQVVRVPSDPADVECGGASRVASEQAAWRRRDAALAQAGFPPSRPVCGEQAAVVQRLAAAVVPVKGRRLAAKAVSLPKPPKAPKRARDVAAVTVAHVLCGGCGSVRTRQSLAAHRTKVRALARKAGVDWDVDGRLQWACAKADTLVTVPWEAEDRFAALLKAGDFESVRSAAREWWQQRQRQQLVGPGPSSVPPQSKPCPAAPDTSSVVQCAGCGILRVRAAQDNHRDKTRKTNAASLCARQGNYVFPPVGDSAYDRAVQAGDKKAAQQRATVLWRKLSAEELEERMAAASKRRRSCPGTGRVSVPARKRALADEGSVGTWEDTEEEEVGWDEGEEAEEEEEEEEEAEEAEEEAEEGSCKGGGRMGAGEGGAVADGESCGGNDGSHADTPEMLRARTGSDSSSPLSLPDSLWEGPDTAPLPVDAVQPTPLLCAPPTAPIPPPTPVSVPVPAPVTAPLTAGAVLSPPPGTVLSDVDFTRVAREFIDQCGKDMLLVWLEEPSGAAVRQAKRGDSQWPPAGHVSQWLWLPLLRYALSSRPCAAWVQLESRFPHLRLAVEAYALDFLRRGIRKGDVSDLVERLTAVEVDAAFNPAVQHGDAVHRASSALHRTLVDRPRSAVPLALYQAVVAVAERVTGKAAEATAAPPS